MSYVAISERGVSGSEWRAKPEQYESILHAFERGDGLLSFTTQDGAGATVRAVDMVAVTFMNDDAIAAFMERQARESK